MIVNLLRSAADSRDTWVSLVMRARRGMEGDVLESLLIRQWLFLKSAEVAAGSSVIRNR
jgi:hypothetical protein